MEYYAIGDNTYYISHHGIVGMKWGIRRFQPYGVGYKRIGGKEGKVVKSDTMLGDAYRGASISKPSREVKRSAKKAVKAARLVGETPSYAAARLRTSAIYDERQARMLGISAATDKSFTKEDVDTYLDWSKDQMRTAKKGYEVADYIMKKYGDTPSNKRSNKEKEIRRFVDQELNYFRKQDLYGYSYMDKMANKKKQSQKESFNDKNKLQEKNINDKVAKAKKTGMYDIGFLEKTQNYSTTIKGKDLDKEYREYLKDPNTYWKKDLHKYYKQDGD